MTDMATAPEGQDISILCAAADSEYFNIPGLDIWTKERDVRNCTTKLPVITHAPCQQWSRMKHFANPSDEKELAFLCWKLVVENGGIFEHPAGSSFFKEVGADRNKILSVDQCWWGFPCRKRTYLYFQGCTPNAFPLFQLPRLRSLEDLKPQSARSHTPLAFNQWLVDSVRTSMANGIVAVSGRSHGPVQSEVTVPAATVISDCTAGERIIADYPGNKSVHGLYHLIINNIPVHDFYYELCAGSAEIARRKAAAQKTILNDIDKTVYLKLLEYSLKHPKLNWHIMNENCIAMLQALENQKAPEAKRTFIYIDPPYLDTPKIYKQGHELEFHQRLINVSSTVKANCMISHYEHPLYDNLVERNGWRKEIFKTVYHGKKVTEAIYMNYKQPKELHDYSLLGDDCWKRQGIKRKTERLINKLKALPVQERNAIIHAITHSQI